MIKVGRNRYNTNFTGDHCSNNIGATEGLSETAVFRATVLMK